MQNEIVNFRYSDTDFIAYLITIGFKYNKIETIKDRNKQLKVYIYFEGEKSKLLNLQEQFQNNNVNINLSIFCNNRKKISKTIKSELLKIQV